MATTVGPPPGAETHPDDAPEDVEEHPAGAGSVAHLMHMDDEITRQRIRPGTWKRVIPYLMERKWGLAALLTTTALQAAVVAAGPLLIKTLIDDGILRRSTGTVIAVAAAIAGLALFGAVISFLEAWFAGRVGHGLVYDLRVQVFNHVQRQPLVFFTRAQTGALVSRLNADVIGTERAVTTLLSQSLSIVLTLVFVLASMFYLSWQVTIAALLLIPVFLWPGRVVGGRLQRLAREGMQQDAEIGSLMNERFNVAGAMLSKLYGRPRRESQSFAKKAARMRDIAILGNAYESLLGIILATLTAITSAVVYGVGGSLVIDGVLQIGTVVALFALMTRLYAPIIQLNSIQLNVLMTLVSFDRIFEVLDLRPLIEDRPGAQPLPGAADGIAPDIEFVDVEFRYPTAAEVSLPSLETFSVKTPERADNATVLHGVSFRAPAGKMTALVGPSGAGKSTITQLVPRLYDPVSGTVRIGGHDLRDVTLESVSEQVGVVAQDAHMFHDTVRANLLFAAPKASEQQIVEACRAAQIWDMISALPNGLDTVVGDHGYRMSGGEKQRVALARLLLKSPPIVVLDEATAHLDSESEAAIQQALETTLAGRTSLVIAHRLSTVRNADQILVIDGGRIRERGTHDELIAAGGLYADLYRTQFAPQQRNAMIA
ncbi:ABC transporter ATP-binding protein [Dactylosporangium sp. NPDC049525]|uniref:ABC transporter ATP-binding protein n=1 Tax=Dactylosporangium sp. NPDC049525 TaxID=3154730 RepID=UPI003423094D